MGLADGLAFSLGLWLLVFWGSVASMDVALLRTRQPGYLWASWRSLRREISDFLDIASADEELLFCASLSAKPSGTRQKSSFGRRWTPSWKLYAKCNPTPARYLHL